MWKLLSTVKIMVNPITLSNHKLVKILIFAEGEDDQLYLPPHLWKRAGFWAPHPSDFNAMRRPTSGSSGQSRTSKKAESNPYHPIPRSVNIGQKNQRSLTPSAEELEGMVEGKKTLFNSNS